VVVENPEGVESGVKYMEVNGKRTAGNSIPLGEIRKGRANKVKVVLGR
jgi:hypothetical protein